MRRVCGKSQRNQITASKSWRLLPQCSEHGRFSVNMREMIISFLSPITTDGNCFTPFSRQTVFPESKT